MCTKQETTVTGVYTLLTPHQAPPWLTLLRSKYGKRVRSVLGIKLIDFSIILSAYQEATLESLQTITFSLLGSPRLRSLPVLFQIIGSHGAVRFCSMFLGTPVWSTLVGVPAQSLTKHLRSLSQAHLVAKCLPGLSSIGT